ncbi:MAG: hypothetical protein B6U85_04045 [Desulfurococcales archaeon ex4484_42]|nr:MAG: hypothetical protein B6U85_04045 [Desulfurococcales archaeon ex4484_42]
MSKKIIKCYVVVKRVLSKAIIRIIDKTIHIKFIPSRLKLTRYLKSSLSPGEYKTILMADKPEYIINIDDISEVLVSTIRSDRKDIKDLFDNEDVKEIFQIVFYLKTGSDIKILLKYNDFLKMKNILKKYGKYS